VRHPSWRLHRARGRVRNTTLVAGPQGLEVLASDAETLPRRALRHRGRLARSSWVRVARTRTRGAVSWSGELDVPNPERGRRTWSAVEDVEEVSSRRGDVDGGSARGPAAGSRLTGLNHVVITTTASTAPRTCTPRGRRSSSSSRRRAVLAYDCDLVPSASHPRVKTGTCSCARGHRGAHAFMANALGMTLLAYGQRRSDKMTSTPQRQGQVRGLGVTGGSPVRLLDGEPARSPRSERPRPAPASGADAAAPHRQLSLFRSSGPVPLRRTVS